MKSICGIDCAKCEINGACKGCAETDGKPFGGDCVTALHCKKGDLQEHREKLIEFFNSLNIPGAEKLCELYSVIGSYINMSYTLPNGQSVKFLEDNKIYLSSQICKQNSDRCYGIAADDSYLLVSEYGKDGADAELVIYTRWNRDFK